MGKKSATKVAAAPAAIDSTKPLKKGKREPEAAVDTKVNLKKQKKDVIAPVQKEKAEKKVPKKVESSDSDDSSDIEEEEPAPKKAVASTNGAVAKKAKDDSSSEEEESSDEEEVAATKKPAAAAKNGSVKAKAEGSSEEDSSDESEDESEDDKESEDEKSAATKDSGSDDSGSDESESEDEKETPKKKNSDVEMADAEKKQPKTPSTPAAGGSKTLFVANLSFNVEKSDVENFFKDVGEVVDVRFAMSKDDGSFRGFGHVEFATSEQAQKALEELNGTPMLGRDVRLDVAQERGERPAYTPQSGAGGNRSGGGGGQSIFVKGFDSSLPEEDIKSALSKHFASCGEITRVSVPCDRDTGASKGIAFLDFQEGADKALDLNGSDMGGWSLVVDQPREKTGGGFSGGGRSGGGGRFSGGGRSGGGRGRDGGRGRRGGGRGRNGGGRGFNR